MKFKDIKGIELPKKLEDFQSHSPFGVNLSYNKGFNECKRIYDNLELPLQHGVELDFLKVHNVIWELFQGWFKDNPSCEKSEKCFDIAMSITKVIVAKFGTKK
jgi:hypothetical protein